MMVKNPRSASFVKRFLERKKRKIGMKYYVITKVLDLITGYCHITKICNQGVQHVINNETNYCKSVQLLGISTVSTT